MRWHVPLRGAAAMAALLGWHSAASGQTPVDFFRDDTVREIRLTIDPADWRTLQEHYLEDTYYPAAFEWNGITMAKIGIKSRGSGSRTPIKPSLNLDFSRYVSSQRFLTMKSFILRNLSQDASLMHERLTLLLFARAGLPSLRAVHTRLSINGGYFGLFLAVEPIEKRYLQTRVGEDTGYLYQMQWVPGLNYGFEYLGDDPDLYVPRLFEPKTIDDAAGGAHLVQMIRTINQSPDSEFAAAVGKYIDLPAFVSHVAAEQFMAESDGVLGDAGMTNFYFYRRRADNRSLFLVWDKDGTFTNSYWPVWHNTDRNVLMRRALAVPELRKRYLDTLYLAAVAAEGPGGWLSAQVERVYEQVRGAALEDPNRVCLKDGEIQRCPDGEMEDWVEGVRVFARERREMVWQQLVEAGYEFPAAATALTPLPATNAACDTAGVLAPGALAMLRVNLPMTTAVWAPSLPLPSLLGGAIVEVGGIRAPVVMVSGKAIEFQVPWDLPCGPAGVRVGWRGEVGNAVTVEIRPGSPAVFAATHLDGRPVTEAEPAAAGELLVAWANGMGPVKDAVADGAASPATTLRNAASIQVGGERATVVWAGLAPGFVGLNQVVFRMPATVPAGNQLPLSIIMNDEEGARFALAVR